MGNTNAFELYKSFKVRSILIITIFLIQQLISVSVLANQCWELDLTGQIYSASDIVHVSNLSAPMSYDDFKNYFRSKHKFGEYQNQASKKLSLQKAWEKYSYEYSKSDFVILASLKGGLNPGDIIEVLDNDSHFPNFIIGNDYILFLNISDSEKKIYINDSCFTVGVTEHVLLLDGKRVDDIFFEVQRELLEILRKVKP